MIIKLIQRTDETNGPQRWGVFDGDQLLVSTDDWLKAWAAVQEVAEQLARARPLR